MESCSQEALNVVNMTLQDYPFQFGPYGEAFACLGQMFLDSASEENLANPQCAMEPLAGEATITINWELPLNGKSQEALFMRINIAYQKATALVGDVRDKKRYRMKAEEMVSLRNLVAFYFQVRDFCSTRIKDFDAFEKRFLSGPGCDHQFHEVLDQRPAQFAISMLPTAKEMAAEEVREQQESSCLEVDKQRVEVRQARWKYFVAALQRDQQQLQQVLAAPLKLEALRHRKEMQWRMEQAKMGEKIVLSYCSKFLRCHVVKQMEHMHEHLHNFRDYTVPGFVNYNWPFLLTCCILIMPFPHVSRFHLYSTHCTCVVDPTAGRSLWREDSGCLHDHLCGFECSICQFPGKDGGIDDCHPVHQ